MEDKAKIIELLMVEALDRIVMIAPLVKEVEVLDGNKNVQHVGRAICELHEVRNEIYSIYPQLKPAIAKEVEELGYELYGERQKEIEAAHLAEEPGDIEKAKKLFQSILEKYQSGTFRMQAEAGLYRCSKANL
ncbi:hypothetical protein LDJ79_10000 [Vibrio tritonius]|uniref:Uncharacterized protein n=1 Tax=Vibrio tritonius TaxID=1435069 RepID=A0ABS7YPS5_9VIBR|nr:hypothetical protein [Vibrio tritonius]MCA2016444.1 hypothetical protein [Vibrio tritonius]